MDESNYLVSEQSFSFFLLPFDLYCHQKLTSKCAIEENISIDQNIYRNRDTTGGPPMIWNQHRAGHTLENSTKHEQRALKPSLYPLGNNTPL